MLAALFLFSFDPVKRERNLFYFLFFIFFHQGDSIPGGPGSRGLAGVPGRRVRFFILLLCVCKTYLLHSVHRPLCKKPGLFICLPGWNRCSRCQRSSWTHSKSLFWTFYLLNSIYDYFKAITDAFLCIRMKKKCFTFFKPGSKRLERWEGGQGECPLLFEYSQLRVVLDVFVVYLFSSRYSICSYVVDNFFFTFFCAIP